MIFFISIYSGTPSMMHATKQVNQYYLTSYLGRVEE